MGWFAIPLTLLAIPYCVRAQDDGARFYMAIPDKTTITSMRVGHLHSNLAGDPGVVGQDDHLGATLVVFQLAETLRSRAGNRRYSSCRP